MSVLRAGSRRWPPKYQALNAAFVGVLKNKRTNRDAKHYKCAHCNDCFPGSEIDVDHKLPIIDPVKGFTTWDSFIENLYCSIDNLQVLCKGCHSKKSAEERIIANTRKTQNGAE